MKDIFIKSMFKLEIIIFRSRKGLHLANLLAVDATIIKPSTMSDNAIFLSLGDDGGTCQAILRAYDAIGGAKGVVMRESGVDSFDPEELKKRLPKITDINDFVFDIHDLDDEALLKLKNDLS
jgi:hypothetical protein